MKIALSADSLDGQVTPALALLFAADDLSLTGIAAEADKLVGGRLAAVLKTGDFQGKAGESLVVYAPEASFERVLLVGLGKAGKLTLESVRDAAGRAALQVRDLGLRSVAIALPDPHTLPWRVDMVPPSVAELARALGEGVLLSQYELTAYRTQDLDDVKRLDHATIVLQGKVEPATAAALEVASATAEAIETARTWILHPGAVLTPKQFADEARTAGEAAGLSVTILDKPALEKGGFRTLLAVGQGSIHEPRLIRLDYHGGKPGDAPIVVVGKGVTFDTGGIGVKPSAGMDKMKYDMAGGAAAIAIILASARLKVPQNIVAIVVAAENMLSGTAIQPGDVVTSYKGLTIEINDTDAEGRLVLADGLAYAATLHPAAIVDMATLTGSVAVALGRKVMGVMGNDQALVDRFLAVAERAGERGWQLPLFEEYEDNLVSHIADMKNYGGRYGDTVNAAAMLHQFVGDIPWLHLDIAGAGWSEEDHGYRPKGPTGTPVRAVVDLIAGWAKRPAELVSRR